MPLLFIEVDNCHETAEELAAKVEKYARFFRRKVKDTDGRERPMWRTRWTAPDTWSGDATHPPVLLVFNRIGERNPNRTIPRLMDLTRRLWEGERQKGGHHRYDGRIPIIATGLNNLSQHGPAGPVFLRFGRDHMERREAADTRAREETARAQQEYQAKVQRAAQEQAAKKAAEREARRPVCAGCGAKFTDERWEAAQATDWGHPEGLPPAPVRRLQAEGRRRRQPSAGTRERQKPVRGEAGQHDFQRNGRRPVCTECGAAFTDERWKATERVGWGTSPEPRPSLCGDCDQWSETDREQTWPGMNHRHEEQDQAVPKQKATGWFSRLRG